MPNWWIDEQGVNNLKGDPLDPNNPVILPDETIVDFLINIPIAKHDFGILLPLMLPGEQNRLRALVAMNPRTVMKSDQDTQIVEDRFQGYMNRTTYRMHDPNRRR